MSEKKAKRRGYPFRLRPKDIKFEEKSKKELKQPRRYGVFNRLKEKNNIRS